MSDPKLAICLNRPPVKIASRSIDESTSIGAHTKSVADPRSTAGWVAATKARLDAERIFCTERVIA
jgi:hypothetical protein